MKISLWSRNPDVDLYLGNYTNCCIRIDSDHMGEESTIADYMTDLGIQVVVISDEKKRTPVVAAWCWTGQIDDGEVSFVIDNIDPVYTLGKIAQDRQKLIAELTQAGVLARNKAVAMAMFRSESCRSSATALSGQCF